MVHPQPVSRRADQLLNPVRSRRPARLIFQPAHRVSLAEWERGTGNHRKKCAFCCLFRRDVLALGFCLGWFLMMKILGGIGDDT